MRITKAFLSVMAAAALVSCGKQDTPAAPGPINPGEPETEDPSDTEPVPEPNEGRTGEVLPPWKAGWLDIHFINGGRGESTYYILPDGTTMLIDAAGAPPAEVSGDEGGLPSKPSAGVSCGSVIVNYIKHFAPPVSAGKLDYFMASHYHGDHIGAWRNDWKTTFGWMMYPGGGFVVNGLPEVGTQIPIGVIIDRGDWGDNGGRASSDYFTDGGKKRYDNYVKFTEWTHNAHGTVREAMKVGRNDQIVLVHDASSYTNFSVRNLAAGGDIWTGSGTGVNTSYMPAASETLKHAMESDWNVNENIYSCAIHLSYGMFDWFSGGDVQYAGRSSNSWKDIETPIAQAVNKKMDAMKASHHSTKNTNSPELLAIFKPDVVLAGIWQSVQPNPATVKNFTTASPKVKFFVTGITDANLSTLAGEGINSDFFQSLGGHVVIRVDPYGVRYWIFVLDDTDQEYRISKKFGPIACS